jgi:proteasome lid subunit RPN8/RPN11
VSLELPADLAAEMESQLQRCYPEEGCGVLIGEERESNRRVRRAMPFENRREDSRHNRYVIAPEQFLAAEQAARAAGLDVLGFYHSHPDHPARPSAFDLEHAWPYYSYVIVSVEQGRVAELRSWRLAADRSRFDPEPLELLPGKPGGVARPAVTPEQGGTP